MRTPSFHQTLFAPKSQSHTASFVAFAKVRNRSSLSRSAASARWRWSTAAAWLAPTVRSKRSASLGKPVRCEPATSPPPSPSHPMGTPTREARSSSFALPTIALAMPPPASPTGVGSFVKKSQLRERPP